MQKSNQYEILLFTGLMFQFKNVLALKISKYYFDF
jgi:hypothetical protein